MRIGAIDIRQIVSPKGVPIVYLLRDDFTTDAAAPLTSPRACEPGPGTLTITDPDNKLSIASGVLAAAGTGAGGTLIVTSPAAITRAAGIAIGLDLTIASGSANDRLILYGAANTYASRQGFLGTAAGANTWVVNVNAGTDFNVSAPLSAGPVYSALLVLRSTGMFYLVGVAGTYTLAWVSNAGNSATVYQYIQHITNYAATFDNLHVLNLGTYDARFATDNGLATSVIASAAPNATSTQLADALVEATWTAVTGETWNLSVRRTDDANQWVVRGDQAGTVKLIEVNGGAETERASAAQTWTNTTAYRTVVTMDGQTIKTYVANTAKNSYTTAAFNLTATGVKTDKAVANMIAYPRTVTLPTV